MRTLTGECFSYVFYSIKSNVHTNLIIAASEFFSQIQFGPQLFSCRGVYTILLYWKAHAPFSGRTDVSLLSNQKRCSRLKDELLLNYSTQMYSSLYHECIFHELMCASVEYFWRNVWLSQTASGGREDGRTGGREDVHQGGSCSPDRTILSLALTLPCNLRAASHNQWKKEKRRQDQSMPVRNTALIVNLSVWGKKLLWT